MKTLRELEGSIVWILTPFLDPKILQKVKLHGVESGGIWIESQKLTEIALNIGGYASSPKTAIYFLPWHQITTIISSLDEVAISEKGFGL
jgi:hypothetical protein